MYKRLMTLLLATVMVACSREEARQNAAAAAGKVGETTKNVGQAIQDTFDPQVPLGPRPTPEEIRKQRFDEEWRQLASFRAEQARNAAAAQARAQAQAQAQAQQDAAAAPQIVTVTKFPEKLDGLIPQAIDQQPVHVPISGDVSGGSVLRTQVMLDRISFGVGVIDGQWGKNSEIAVYMFQQQQGITPTGDVDEQTFRALAQAAGNPPTVVSYTITADDVKGPFTKIPDDVYDKEKLDCLCYESLAEELSEKFHTTTDTLKLLNPGVDFLSAQAGQTIVGLNVRPPITTDLDRGIAKIVISVRGNSLNALDASGNILFHAPTTLGSKYDPSPSETLTLGTITFDPNFHYQPTLFHEVPDTDPEAHLKPGPNSPVGLVWMALSKPHYGIHGTDDPDSIGYASSHGCVRLANWDAHDLGHSLKKGITVEFVDTRHE